MRTVPASITDGWVNPYKIGPNRSSARVTVQRMSANFLQYDLDGMNSAMLKGTGVFCTIPFGQQAAPIELSNVSNVSWNKSVDQFCGDATISISNTHALPVGVLSDDGEFEQPGAWTYNRGESTEAQSNWGHEPSYRNGLLVPDRIVRIYEGSGSDTSVPADEDPNLVITFTGIITSIELNADKSLVIKCQDMGSVLLNTIAFPDVVPFCQYPIWFETYHQVAGPLVPSTVTTGSWQRATYATDSNIPYIGRGFQDGNMVYVSPDGSVNGNLGRYAFDSDMNSYFLSVGNYKNWSSSYEWVEGTTPNQNISAVAITTLGGPYTCYVSVKIGGVWQGNHKIPYVPRVVDTGAAINFVKKQTISKNGQTTIDLPQVYGAVQAIRITVTDLWDSGVGKFQYRGAIKDVQHFVSTSTVAMVTGPTVRTGNVSDFSDVVSWFLAWGGLFWPRESSGFAYHTRVDGEHITHAPPGDYSNLPHGNIWGDIQKSGTYPITKLPIDQFDKQPLSDCLTSIKEILGFNLYFDEFGGAVFRLPNIFQIGNYVASIDGGPNQGRTSDIVVIDEEETLLGLNATISSNNVREKIFVANLSGKFGSTTAGFNPYPSNLRRYAVWSDTRWQTLEECRVMSDLISVRQMVSYRKDTVTIPGNPQIQIDDQIKIKEKVTSDTYYHYVNGISSNNDLVSGKWTYTLTTNWLGEDPDMPGAWSVDSSNLYEATRQYLENLRF